MTDRDDIAELASKLGLLIDARDWDAAETLFCEQVDLDYTSLNGGQPERLSPAEVVGAWKQNLGALEATQHLIANHVVVVQGDEGTVAANVTAGPAGRRRRRSFFAGRPISRRRSAAARRRGARPRRPPRAR